MIGILQKKVGIIAIFVFIVMIYSVNTSVLRAQTIVSSTTSREMLELMRGEGYAVEFDSDGDLLWKNDGYRTWIFVQNEGRALQFYTVFTGSEATQQKLHDFNAEHKYMRTYFNKKGNPCLEADLDLVGGVTTDRILDYLKTCKVILSAWIKAIS